jgi:hypothetical protein
VFQEQRNNVQRWLPCNLTNSISKGINLASLVLTKVMDPHLLSKVKKTLRRRGQETPVLPTDLFGVRQLTFSGFIFHHYTRSREPDFLNGTVHIRHCFGTCALLTSDKGESSPLKTKG